MSTGRYRWGSGVLLAALICAVLAVSGLDSTVSAQAVIDYDADDDGLIEVASEAQLNAIRWDLDGNGAVDVATNATTYAAAFPTPAAGMGCPGAACTGYELAADITLTSNTGMGWEPLGDSTTKFTATFDGNAPDYTIDSLFINRTTDNIGLFGATGATSSIRNVKLTSVNVTGNAVIGALVGLNAGPIVNCEASGAVTATRTGDRAYAGGLVGANDAVVIQNSHASVDVTASHSFVGGLVGLNWDASAWTSGTAPQNAISGSTASGTVTTTGINVGGLVGWTNGTISDSAARNPSVSGADSVGGLVGRNEDAQADGSNPIARSSATASVTGTGNWVGGLVGRNNGPISDSAARNPSVSGADYVGGLVGANEDAQDDGSNPIARSSATAIVTGTGSNVGGLVGWNNGPISDSAARNPSVSGADSVGGLVGQNRDAQADGSNLITSSVATASVTGTGADVGGLVGWNNGVIRDSYAGGAVRGLSFMGGLVGWNHPMGQVIDSRADGAVGDSTAAGTENGGLVGKNWGSVAGSVATGTVSGSGASTFIGGLVGQNHGPISGSAATGAVSGGQQVGGLVGWNGSGTGSVTESSASGAVNAVTLMGTMSESGRLVGGLIGRNSGLAGASFATGDVSGAGEVGGLIGLNEAASKVVATYATGNVSGPAPPRCPMGTSCPPVVGGLIGEVRGRFNTSTGPSSVEASYSTGAVSGSSTHVVGGLAGAAGRATAPANNATFTNSYWDTDTSGRTLGAGSDDEDKNGVIALPETATAGVTGQTTTALKTPTGYTGIFAAWSVTITGVTTPAGGWWDFGGTTDYPTLRGPSAPPSFPAGTVTFSIAEEGAANTSIGTPLTATDSDGDAVTYKLIGADGAYFSINGMTGQLLTKDLLDYENPADGNRDNTYEVMVQARDGTSVAFRTVSVTVQAVAELPEIEIEPSSGAVTVSGSAVSVDENHTGDLVEVTATDPDGIHTDYTLALGGTHSTSFALNVGVLGFTNPPDHEAREEYRLTLTASNSSESSTLDVTVTVLDVDEPADISFVGSVGVTVNNNMLTVAENYDGSLATFTASDPENNPGLTYTWSTDAPVPFAITAAGVLSFVNIPDYELPAGGTNVYDITVSARDSDGETGRIAVTVTVLDVDEPADISFVATGGVTVNNNTLTVAENYDGSLATFTASDPENKPGLTYTWSTNAPVPFAITATGVLSFVSIPDYELPADGINVYDIMVSALDSDGVTVSIAITVTVEDVDELPEIELESSSGAVTVSGSAVSVDENHTGDLVEVTATDPDGIHTHYTLALGGTHSTSFTLNAGVLSFTSPPDHEARDEYRLTLTASNVSESSTLDVTVTVLDVNEPPIITGEAEVSLNEVVNPTLGQVVTVGVYGKSDPDLPPQPTNWGPVGGSQVLSGVNSDAFEFDQLTGMLTFASPPDYEDGGGQYQVTVTANDGAEQAALDVTVNVANVEEAGTLTLGARRGVLNVPLEATLEDPDVVATQTWKWQRSTTGTSGWTDIANTDSPSYTPGAADSDNYLRASVTYTDGTGPDETTLTADTEFETVNEAGSNQPPTPPDPLPEVADVRENAPALRNVVRVVFTDPEGEQNLAYSLSSGSAEFEIGTRSAWIYVRRGGLNYEQTPSYSVTVRAADSFGAAAMVTLTIGISDVSEPPEAADLAVTVTEDETVAIDVVTEASDEDAGDTLTVSSVVRDPQAGTVTVDDVTNEITYTPRANYNGSDNFTYRVKDQGDLLSNVATVTITVTAVNDAPEFVATPPERSVSELAQHGDPVGAPVTAMDLDGDDLTYTLTGSLNFEMLDGTAQITVVEGAVLDATNAPTHMVTVAVADEDGATARIDVTITVTAVNDAPEFVATPPERSVSELAQHGDPVGAPVTAMDLDGDGLTYKLTGSTDFEMLDGTAQITVVEGVVLDATNAPTHMVTVTVADGNGGTASIVVTITVTPGPVVMPPPTGGGGGAVGGGGGGGGGPSPSVIDFEWSVTRDIDDLDSGHDKPSGLWSDGTTLWILENGSGTDDAVYAYDLESGERVEDREFELDDTNRAPRGIWSDGSTVWVSDSGRNRLFAHAHALGTGERVPERDITLADRNSDARGIWSGDETMWVLDGGKDSLFAYDLASGDLLAEYELASTNGDPQGVWSDGVTVWASDHGAKRLFAYRLPARPEAPAAEDAEPQALERVSDEEFTDLSKASNNSPRGIWSDGDVMYVVDESDAKVYTYNMPNAFDARLSSLTLSGIDFGEFSPNDGEYEGAADDGVTVTTAEAAAMQRRTSVTIDPPDADGAAGGHQVALEDLDEITVTVTSADGSRMKTYRVRLGPEEVAESAQEEVDEPVASCLRGDIAAGFSLVLYGGGGVEDLVACAKGRNVTALYVLDGGAYVSYIPGAPELVNRSFAGLFTDGVPALTPLVAKSEGPASPDPAGTVPRTSDATQPWPECLRGDVATGFSLVVYEGGSVEDIEACARGRGVTAMYTLHEGAYVSYILGAPALVNQSFAGLFADGVPPVTPLVVKRDAP